MSKKVKHFHFIGIGGAGMGTLASLLVAKGFSISGSDLKESEFTSKLKSQGAKVFIGHDAKHIAGADCVVYSSAIKKDNPEFTSTLQNGIPILQRAQLLAELMEKEKGITVAGAHGKTTTTSMISCLLVNAGFKPTTAVGGIINGSSHHADLGEGKYFVAEVDESDGSFLYFSPHYSVITNIDFEHVDYYGNWENILESYRRFIKKTRTKGHLFIYGEDVRLVKLARESGKEFLAYGFSPQNDCYAQNLSSGGYSSGYECIYKGKILGSVDLKIPGKHNILNSLACVSVGIELGIDWDVISRVLGDFTGVKRRFQLKGEINDIMIIDDYGHHPTEIAATIEAAKSFGKKRVIVAFQPHRYTRTKFLMDEFVTSLSKSDYLVLTDIYAASEKPIEGVTSQSLFEKIKKAGPVPVTYLKKEKITEHLLKIAKPGDLILTLGAGDITKISDELVVRLKKQYQGTLEVALKGRS